VLMGACKKVIVLVWVAPQTRFQKISPLFLYKERFISDPDRNSNGNKVKVNRRYMCSGKDQSHGRKIYMCKGKKIAVWEPIEEGRNW
jgi:hypothetical protein